MRRAHAVLSTAMFLAVIQTLVAGLAPVHAVTASDVSNTSVGNLQSTNVQSSLAELDTEKDHQVLYVEDFAKLYPSSTTGGIQETIDACSSPGYGTRLGCRIVLPRGHITITSTIQIGGLTTTTARSGIILQGHGSSFETTSPPDLQMAGTAIRWAGATGGTMLRLAGTSHFRLQDFALDGDVGDDGGAAGVGIEMVADNETSAVTHGGLVENIHITDIKEDAGTPHSGPAIYIHGAGTSPEDDQVDEIKFLRVEVTESTECIRTESGQSLMNTWIGGTCGFERYGAAVIHGAQTFIDSFFSQKTSTDLASIYIGPGAGFVDIRDCDFETIYGDTILTASSGPPDHLLIEGNNFLMLGDPDLGSTTTNASFVKVNSGKKVTLQGNSFWTNSANTSVHADLRFETNDGNGVNVFSAGNAWTAGHVHVTVTGTRASLVATDSLISQSDPLGGSNTLDLYKTGLVFPSGESIIWRDGGTPPVDRYKVYYNSTELKFLDGSNSTLATLSQGNWIASNNLVANKSVGIGGFYNGSYTCLSKEASTGRVYADANCDQVRGASEEYVGAPLTGDVTSAPSGGNTVVTIGNAAVEPSDLNSTNAASTGLCVTKAANDQFTWAPCDAAAASETDILVFSTGATTINATRHLGPNSGANHITENIVSVPMPARTAKSFQCKVSVAPGNGKSWTLTARAAGATLLTCSISGTQTSCPAVTGSVSWTDGSAVSVLATAAGNPASATIGCSLGIAP